MAVHTASEEAGRGRALPPKSSSDLAPCRLIVGGGGWGGLAASHQSWKLVLGEALGGVIDSPISFPMALSLHLPGVHRLPRWLESSDSDLCSRLSHS